MQEIRNPLWEWNNSRHLIYILKPTLVALRAGNLAYKNDLDAELLSRTYVMQPNNPLACPVLISVWWKGGHRARSSPHQKKSPHLDVLIAFLVKLESVTGSIGWWVTIVDAQGSLQSN